MFLAVAPWTALWYQAARGLMPEPYLNAALSGWARGAVTGIGVLDLWVAVHLASEMASVLRAPREPETRSS